MFFSAQINLSSIKYIYLDETKGEKQISKYISDTDLLNVFFILEMFYELIPFGPSFKKPKNLTYATSLILCRPRPHIHRYKINITNHYTLTIIESYELALE